jgi:hypothetical protein
MNTSNDNPGRTERDDALLRALRRLPQAIEPPRDLWADIDAGIHAHLAPAARTAGTSAERGRSIRWPYALAAGFGCMALGALLAFAVLRESAPAQVAATAAPSATPADIQDSGVRYSEANFGGYEALGPEYEQARAQLAFGLAERIDRLPPEAQLKIERNLAEIRRSLREINVALALEPDNTMLQQLLLSTYQSELTMLANVNQMAGSIPARTET